MLLCGSYRTVVGMGGSVQLTPDIMACECAISMVGIKRAEREAMAFDLTAMCAEYCAVQNKRHAQ